MTALALAVAAAAAVLLWPARADVRAPVATAGGSRGRGAGHAHRASADGGAATAYAIADAMLLLSLALRSGMGQREALAEVARGSEGGVAAHLQSVAAALGWGFSPEEAWGFAPSAWQPAASAWQVAEATGAGPAQLVEDASWRVREREDRRLEAAGARAGVRLVLPLGLAFLPAFACTTVIPVVLALGQRVLGT
ncbi:MAG TPA: type II secretion system F family protein [Pedococcus sp.]|uniref:type II secretion system F family protein n=1 Tax=Pedococcus sp. TaxID=2860345 RepID=UPI002F925708